MSTREVSNSPQGTEKAADTASMRRLPLGPSAFSVSALGTSSSAISEAFSYASASR